MIRYPTRSTIDDEPEVLRHGRFYAKWAGEEPDETDPEIIPYPRHYCIWEKVGDLELTVDRKDAENLRALLDEMIAKWADEDASAPSGRGRG